MSRIFISHATADNAKTCAVIDWIVSQGWSRDDVFVDFDLTNGIAGGERWREALERALKRCETCVFLISPAWADSDWCPGEATAAQLLGKQVIPVLIEATPFDRYGPLLTHEYQLIDLTLAGPRRSFKIVMPGSGHTETVELAESGLQALRVGLERAGLAPSTFPLVPGRPIYPGLAPLDIDDAAVFFGRDAEIERGLKELRLTRDCGECLLAILAASGAGKSSFLRAGLWPRLQRADTEFLILPVLRPGTHALEALVASLHGAGEALELKRNRADWRAQLEQGDLAGALRLLQNAARARLPAAVLARTQSASRPGADAQADLSQTHPNSEHAATPPIPVLPIDQAEELFGPQGGEPARRVLDLLGTALREGRLIALCAIRTDRYDDLQAAPALDGLDQRLFSLPPIVEGTLKDVIEGPALRDQKANGAKGLRIDAQLTDRLLQDWADTDGLPLLAFTLRRLLDDYGSDGQLTLQDYEHSGQLRGALEAAIGRAMQAATAAGTLPEGSQEREALIRKTFVPLLVSVDPQSQEPLRRIALRSELPAETRDLIDRLIDARLLTCDRPHDSDATVEVAHEAILHHWPLLERIIGQEREALIVLNEVRRDAEAWVASAKNGVMPESEGALLHWGERLQHAEQHLGREDFQEALGKNGRRYLAACRAKEAHEAEDRRLQRVREANQIAKTQKFQKRATLFLAAAIAVITIAGVFLTKMQKATSQASADVLANLASEASNRHQHDRAIRFALAGIGKRDSSLIRIDISRSEEQSQRAAYASNLRASINGAKFSALHVSPNGAHIASFDVQKRMTVSRINSGNTYTKNLRQDAYFLDAVFSNDGKYLVIISKSKLAPIIDLSSGRELTSLLTNAQIERIAFSPDSSLVVTTSRDPISHIWETRTGRPVAALRHGTILVSATFSHRGSRVATIGGDNTVSIWKVSSGQKISTLKHESRVSKVAFCHDENRIVTISNWNRSIRIWDENSGKLILDLAHNGDDFRNLLSTDCRRAITKSANKIIHLWDSISGRLLATLSHDGAIMSADFSPDGRYIVTASNDRTTKVWESISGDLHRVLKHDNVVYEAKFSPDGRQIATISEDNTLLLWESNFEYPVIEMPHESQIHDFSFSTNSRLIITTTIDKITRVWSTTKKQSNARIMTNNKSNGSVISEYGSYFLTSDADSIARVYDVSSGSLKGKFPLKDAIGAILSPKGDYALTLSHGGTIHLWEAVHSKLITSLRYNAKITHATFNNDGSHLAIARDHIADVLDVGSGKPIAQLEHDSKIVFTSFSPEGRRIATTSANGVARIWDVYSSRLIAELRHEDSINSASFSRDGDLIATASTDGTARVWEAISGNLIQEFPHGGREVWRTAFSRDGRRVVTTSDGDTARIWNTDNGELLMSIRHPNLVLGGILNATFSADERQVITAGIGSTVNIWSSVTGDLLATLDHASFVQDATYTKDGKKVITKTQNGEIHTFDTELFMQKGTVLVNTICRDILNVNTNAPPRNTDLSRLTDEELQMAAVIDPNTERDVCRPPTRWQRFASMFDIGG